MDNKCMIVYYIGMENENLIPFLLVTFFGNKNVYYSNISFEAMYPLRIRTASYTTNDLAWRPEIFICLEDLNLTGGEVEHWG